MLPEMYRIVAGHAATRATIRWVVVLLFGVVGPFHLSSAMASSITVSTSFPDCGIESTSGATSASLSGNKQLVTPGGGCHAGTDLHAQVDANQTSVKIHVDAANPANLRVALGVQAGTNILDTLTIGGGTGSGTLVMSYLIQGTLTATDRFAAGFSVDSPTLGLFPVASWQACGGNTHFGGLLAGCDIAFESSVTVNETVSLSYAFTFGTPINTQIQFSGGTGLWFGSTSSNTGSGSVDFDHTASLQPFVIFDAAGNQLGGASVVSDSGLRYAVADPTVTAVPEPASLLLLVGGLTSIGARRWRQKHARP